jgi:SAM-dependent methyltransferase
LRLEQFRLHAAIEAEHWWFAARRAIVVRVIRQLIPASKDVTIADVGCGTGGNISALAGLYNCVGIDTSEEAIELARSRFSDVTFICGHAPKDLGPWKNTVDVFMLLDVLEHVEHDRAFFLELFDALRPGGHMLLTVPANMSLWSPQDVNYGHYRRYEPAQLQALWAGLPVSVRLFSFFNTYLYPLVKAVRTFNRLRNREWGEAGTDLSIPPRPVNKILTAIFAREGKVLAAALASDHRKGFPFGVSLMACVQKDEEVQCRKS